MTADQIMQGNNLVQKIIEHGHTAFLSESGTNIHCRSQYTRRDEYDGKVWHGSIWETIPATIPAVKDWLGY